MKTLWITVFALAVLALALGPVLLSEKTSGNQLIIISPHWDGIRREFGRAFEEFYKKKHGDDIHVVWMDMGGTGEIRKYIAQRFTQSEPGKGIGVDILFGGGMDMLPRMADANMFETFPLPPELGTDVFPDKVNGQLLRDPKNRYYAACLGGFGFVVNTQVVERAKLKMPETWEDLGAPEMRGWISCGDPAQSGSLHQAFELVLQAEGYEKGYTTLQRMVSNVRAFNEGGTSIPRDVSLGQAAAGPCIDFYATAPMRRQGATHLQLVIPKNVAIATPDCIAMLRSPPNKEAAAEFMTFVLSEEGQRLWYQKRGTEGGPKDYDLERLPVIPAIYKRGYPTNTVTNPFEEGGSAPYDGAKGGARWDAMNLIWRAMAIDVQDKLWDARKAVIDAGKDDTLGVLLCHAPLSEQDVLKVGKALGGAMTPDQKNALRNQWSAWARDWYAKVADAARNGTEPPEFKPAPMPETIPADTKKPDAPKPSPDKAAKPEKSDKAEKAKQP